MRGSGRLGFGVLVVLLVVGVCVPAVALEDLAPVLPEETLLYVRVAGPTALAADMARSRLMTNGSVLADAYLSQMALLPPFLSSETGIPKEKWERAFASVQGAHMALFGVGDDLGSLDAVAAVETSEPVLFREILEKLLGEQAYFAGEVAGSRVMAVDVEDEDATFFFATHEGVLFASSRAERITAVLTARAAPPERSLATSPRYRAGTLRASPEATLFAYADLQHGFDLMASVMPEYELRGFMEAYDMADLGKLHSVAVVAEANTTRARLTYDPEHRWMKIWKGEAGSGSLSAFVPEGAMLFTLECGSIEKKWSGMKTILTDQQIFPEADEVKEELAEIEQFLGVTFDELAKTLGSQWGMFMPVEESGRVDDDDMTLLFEIGDREAFDLLVGRLMESPAMAELREQGEDIVIEMQGDAKLMYPKADPDREVPGLAIIGDALLMSGDVNSVRAALAAKASGRNLLATDGASLSGIPSSFVRLITVGMDPILMDESEFTPLLDLVRPGALIVAATDEAPGRMDLNINHSVTSFVTFLMGGELISERYSEQRAACLSNLREVHHAIEDYREKKGEYPPNLRALVPDFLEKDRLICPLDHGKEDVDCSYHDTLSGAERGEWQILGWCPNRLHRRLALYYGGNAYSTRERSFLRQLLRQGVDPR